MADQHKFSDLIKMTEPTKGPAMYQMSGDDLVALVRRERKKAYLSVSEVLHDEMIATRHTAVFDAIKRAWEKVIALGASEG